MPFHSMMSTFAFHRFCWSTDFTNALKQKPTQSPLGLAARTHPSLGSRDVLERPDAYAGRKADLEPSSERALGDQSSSPRPSEAEEEHVEFVLVMLARVADGLGRRGAFRVLNS